MGALNAAGAAPEVDALGNNLQVKSLLTGIEESGFLTKLAQSGLLSKAKQAGISLSTLEPFLELASQNPSLLVLVEASGPDVLPLLPTLVDLAPAALPLLALALGLPPIVLSIAGIGALGGAGASIYLIPDNTVFEVAEQTLLAGTLLGVGGIALGASFAILNPVGAAKSAFKLL